MTNNKVVIEIDLSGEIVKITKELIESEKDSDKTYPPDDVPMPSPELETDKEAWKRIKKIKINFKKFFTPPIFNFKRGI